MKTVLIVLLAILAISFAGIYLFIPPKINISKTMEARSSLDAANRFLANKDNWRHRLNTDPGVQFNPYNEVFNGMQVAVVCNATSMNSTLHLIAAKNAAVSFNWTGQVKTGANPFTRISRYQDAKLMALTMETVLERLRQMLEDDKYVYGFKVENVIIKDTLLIATQLAQTTPPTTQQLYQLIGKLQQHIRQQGAQQTGPPMLNASGELMVAIPINKRIAERKDLQMKFMVAVPMLVAEVRGGPATALHGFDQMELYMRDHRLASPVKPFYSLVTDRMQEPDTSKWVTRICYPIY